MPKNRIFPHIPNINNKYFPKKVLGGLLTLLLVLIGTAVSMAMIDKGQDLRQQASYPYPTTPPRVTDTPRPTATPIPQPTIPPEQQACIAGGGVWRNMPNGCVDRCGTEGMMCTQAITPGCDCGTNQCWNGKSCVPNPVIGCKPLPDCAYNPAQECMLQEGPYCKASDFDADGDVDYSDYAYLNSKYFESVSSFSNIRADLNRDKVIDVKDYSVFVNDWTGPLPSTDR